MLIQVSAFLQRLIFLRRLSSVARVFGVSASVEHLLPLLPRLAADKEDVIRQAVGIEVAALLVFLANPLKPQPQPVRPKLTVCCVLLCVAACSPMTTSCLRWSRRPRLVARCDRWS